MRIKKALEISESFIENLTYGSSVNYPERIVKSENDFFSWDNEHRCKKNGQPYLYSWSYYNGVIFEGLKYIYEQSGDEKLIEYVRSFLDAMITDGQLNEHAGYVPYHGVDCYKTASLLARICLDGGKDNPLNEEYARVLASLYHDLTVVNAKYSEETLGGNYWHSWAGGKMPKYKVWLDGIYMIQPFLTRYARLTGDDEQLDKIFKRFCWVADELRSPEGLYYHAGNGKDDVCKFFWLRAIGWYAMAQVDVMEYMPEKYIPRMKNDLKLFIDGMLKYQDASGMWKNLVDQPLTDSNRLETSGSAMMVYCILKAIRLGWIDDIDGKYASAAKKAFCCMVEEKYAEDGLTDIYLMAAASGVNNYENLSWYKVNEGKGIGPFIMAYSEMIRI
ncbi:MAG: glycoside hydrolase family 88 protein [Clostridia bacterium]|nr:glycoside hydrolase family 88 protein [Clostridia bacterium]